MKKLLITPVITFLYVLPCMAQWIPQNSGGNGFLTQVFFPSQDTGYVVDWNMPDSLLKTTNGGNDWNRIPSIFPIVFFYFTSSDTGYAITANQEIIQTTNGGLNWSVQKHFTNFTFLGAISFSDKNTGYTCGFHTTENDTLFFIRTTDGGITWNEVSWVYGPFMGAPHSSCISFPGRDVGFIVGYDGLNIYRTSNGCSTVQQLCFGGPFTSIHFPTRAVGYAGAYPDKLYKTTDYGNSWGIISLPTTDEIIQSMYFTSKDTGYISTFQSSFSPGKILHTTDGGSSWITQDAGATIYSIHFANDTVGYAVGAGGRILKYTGRSGGSIISPEMLITYPNPTKGELSFHMNKFIQNGEINMFNTIGQKVFSTSFTGTEYTFTPLLNAGMYFLLVNEGEDSWSTKVLIE